MTSQNRQSDNAGNSRRGAGPVSPEGKARSTTGGLAHGLSACEVVLPNESAEEFQALLDQWTNYYQTSNPAQLALIERAVVAKWRLDRCSRIETERLALRVRHAQDAHDQAQIAEAEFLGQRLVMDPLNHCHKLPANDPFARLVVATRISDRACVLTRQLQTSAHGIAWLLRSWHALGGMLRVHGFWDYPEKARAVRLLGRNPEDVLQDAVVERIYLACHVLHPSAAGRQEPGISWLQDCEQSRAGRDVLPLNARQVANAFARRPDSEEAARSVLLEIVRAETSRLRALKDELDLLDASDIASAPERAMFDGSPEALLLRRYETAVEREFHRSIALLRKLRKGAPVAVPNPPA